MKKVLRWIIYTLLVVLALAITAILSLDPIARRIAQRQLQQQTGMQAVIGKLKIGFAEQTIHIENLRLINPPEFGGTTFIDIPEFHVQADWQAARNHRVHINLLRLKVAEIHLVRNKEGRSNTDLLLPHHAKNQKQSSGSPAQTDGRRPEFAGIDTFQITIGRAKVTDELHPNRSFDRDLGIRDTVYRDIRTEADLKVVMNALALKAGAGLLLENLLATPKTMEQSASTELKH